LFVKYTAAFLLYYQNIRTFESYLHKNINNNPNAKLL